MKKILAIISAVSLVLCLLTSSLVSVGAQGTYTKVYAPKILNEAGDGEYAVNPTDEDFPKWVEKVGTQFTPAEDPSNFGFNVGMKFTNPASGQTQMYFSPMSYADAAGFIIKIKCDSTTDFRIPIYAVYHDGNSMLQRYQWGYTNWYILEKDASSWKTSSVEGYGVTMKAGFDGYLYIPFETLKNNGDTTMKNTDKIHGIIAWAGSGFTEATLSLPMFVDRATLDSNGLPTADKVVIGDAEHTYFKASPNPGGEGSGEGSGDGEGEGDSTDNTVKLPEYTGDTIEYGSDITKIKDMPVSGTFKIGETLSTDTIYDFEQHTTLTLLKNENPMSGYPLIKSSGRETGYEGAGSCLYSLYADGKNSAGAEGLIMYVKMPEDSPATTVEFKYNFYAGGNLAKSRSAWQYSGKCWIMGKEDNNWKESEIFAYQLELPAGFEGFILMDYKLWACEGQEAMTKADALKQINFYVPGWSGGDIYASIPWLITDMGDRTSAVYLNDETKCARSLWDGSVVEAEDFEITSSDIKIGDTFDILPESNTDKVINDPEDFDYTDSGVNVSWEAFDGAVSYRAELYSKTFTMDGLSYTLVDMQTANGTSVTLNGMASDTSYSVVVRAFDAKGKTLAIYDSITVMNSSDDGFDDSFDDDFENGFEDGFDDFGDDFSDDFGDDFGDGFDDYDGMPTTGQSGIVYLFFSLFILSSLILAVLCLDKHKKLEKVTAFVKEKIFKA